MPPVEELIDNRPFRTFNNVILFHDSSQVRPSITLEIRARVSYSTSARTHMLEFGANIILCYVGIRRNLCYQLVQTYSNSILPPPLRRNSSLIFREFSSSTRRQNVKHLFWTSFSKCVADSPISNDTRRARHLSPRSYPGCTYPITSVSWSGIWIHPVWRYSDAFLKISYTATTHERETSKSPNVEIRCWIFSHDSSTVQTESNKNLANRRAQFFIVLVSRSNLSYTCPFPRIFTFLCCL